MKTKKLTLEDLEWLAIALETGYDLTLNHDERDILELEDEKLKKFPFVGEKRKSALRAREVYRKLFSLVTELKTMKPIAYASIEIEVTDHWEPSETPLKS